MTPVPELDDLIATVGDRSPSGFELDRLRAATAVAREVGRVGEDLVTHFVDEARAAGASWSDIGDVLGITRQGAHQRHQDRPDPQRRWRADLGRFTPRARHAAKAAIQEAAAAGHSCVGTEHLLLGVLDVPGNVGLAALERCGIDPGALRSDIRSRMAANETPSPSRPARARRWRPFTPHARRVFDLATGEALGLGHNYIGCEHLLTALAQGEGIAAEALRATGVDVDRLRSAVIDLLTNYG
ncbi:MAG: Clp protease N-terminal domain-containing protein [Acidimicrobiales bacterium]